MAGYNANDLSRVENINESDIFVLVNPSQVGEVRSLHDIHLTENAQVYSIVVGENIMTLVDNSGIMTYYSVKHCNPDEDIEYQENERLMKEAQEAEKRRI